jgi:iron complex outermembrane recepter protein
MIKTYTLIFCLSIISTIAAAQVSGNVKSPDQQAVVGATVSILKPNNKLIKATFTDAEGKFEFEKIAADSCKISVSYLGFVSYFSDLLVLKNTTSLVLPTITLVTSATNLQEVKVVAQKPFVERKLDRIVVNVDALIGNAGATALEVLEKAPGITLDQNDGLKLKGKAGVMVFIDDKPTYLAAADLAGYLKSLPSGSIETIEIMTNPPAKYDAAGNAGIINIKLKKNITKGFNGGINLSFGQGKYGRTNNSFNFNYRINKFNFFSNTSVNQNNNYQDLTIWRRYYKPTGEYNSAFTQNSYIKKENGSANVKLGFDYYISKKATMGVVLTGFRNPSARITTNNAQILDISNQIVGNVEAYNPTRSLWKNGSINLNSAYKLDSTGKELSVNLDYINYNSAMSQTLTNAIFDAKNKFVNQTILDSSLPTDITIKTAKIDYAQPLAAGSKFEAGAKASFINTENVADFVDVVEQNRTPNYDFSNSFNYNENINAAYLNYSKNYKKLAIQLGLRFENTNIRGHQLGNIKTKDSTFIRNYNNVFPTFYAQYQLDSTQKNQIGLSLGRRIERPNYQDMNPFSYPMDRFTYYGGNPFLQPTFSYNIELSHTYKNKFTTTLEYSIANNIISETNEQRGTIYYSRPGNFGEQIIYGISFNGAFQPYKWWTIQMYGMVQNRSYKAYIYQQTLNESRPFWLIMPTNQFKINALWSAELAGAYQSKVLSGQFLVLARWTMQASVSKKILKNRGAIKFNFSDILYTNQVGGDIRNIANATANWYSYLDTRVAAIAFSYRFNKGKTLNIRQSGGSDAEKNRVKS